jgi:hypothetical protein
MNWEDERRLRGVERGLESGLFRERTTPSYKDLMRFFWSELISDNFGIFDFALFGNLCVGVP